MEGSWGGAWLEGSCIGKCMGKEEEDGCELFFAECECEDSLSDGGIVFVEFFQSVSRRDGGFNAGYRGLSFYIIFVIAS
jgi:hypothetical protein